MLTIADTKAPFLMGENPPRRGRMPREISDITGPYPRLGERAREFSAGLTARVLARKTGLSYDTISRVWNGERLKIETLLKFAHGLGLSEAQTSELMAAADYGFGTFSDQIALKTSATVSVKGEASEVINYEIPPERVSSIARILALTDAEYSAVDLLLERMSKKENPATQ
jgi:transcriptional regulator with XRE-family HTH domain